MQKRQSMLMKLQCGHDPEAVERREANEDRAAREMLQCGHDPEAVERMVRPPSIGT